VTFAIRHVAEQDGVSREYIVHEVEPIGFTEFCEHLDGGRDTFHVKARGRVHAAPDLPVGTKMKIGHTVVFHSEVKHYALVPGGVLPPDYLLRGGTRLLMDRNVVSDLRDMPEIDVGPPHHLRWLNTDGFHVNPILGVMEGSKRRPQTYGEFEHAYNSAERLVRRKLPRTKAVQFSGKRFRDMFDLHRQFAPRMALEAGFLRAVAPQLADQVRDVDLCKTEHFILQAAHQAGLRPLTFVVLVAMAKLYEGNSGSPAAELLKLADLRKAGATWGGCAYNAIADIRQMEFLSTGSRMPDLVVALTGDLGLAKVWCGLRPTGVDLEDGRVGFYFQLDPALFPRLEGGTEALLDRMKNNSTVAGE
jgi:hypothetical protein